MSVYCEWDECAVAGKHLSECEDLDCLGCRPRLSEYGRVCLVHWSWMNRDLARVAELVEQTREAMIRGPVGDESPVSGGGSRSPAPFDTGAVDASDELIAQLVSTATAVGEEIGVRPPRVIAWRTDGRAMGFRAGTTPGQASRSAGVLASWFRDQLEQIARLPDVLDFGPELHERVWSMSKRWPAAEQPRHLPGTPCRQCDLMDLWWTPPTAVGWPITVECHTCDYIAPEQDLTRLTRMVDHELSMKRKSNVGRTTRISDEWLTGDEVEQQFGISRTTFWRWRKSHVIREARFSKRMPVRFNREDILVVARSVG